jgi:hypothetical protein
MIETDALILDRKDLHLEYRNDAIENISVNKFKYEVYKEITKKSVALFIDYDGATKMIKNRYGKPIKNDMGGGTAMAWSPHLQCGNQSESFSLLSTDK